MPQIVGPGVFDAFLWAQPTHLDWISPPAWDPTTRFCPDLPLGLIFLCRESPSGLPCEARVGHLPRLEVEEAWVLAPYAIDDATDWLFETGTAAASLLRLHASNLNALFWGLHDWAHFHCHGPFIERARTELQCDSFALYWIRLNRRAIGVDEATLADFTRDVARHTVRRFEGEGLPPEALPDWALGA